MYLPRGLEHLPYGLSHVDCDWKLGQNERFYLQLYLRSFYKVIPKAAEAKDDPFHNSKKFGYEHIVGGIVAVPREVTEWEGDFDEDFWWMISELSEKYREVCVSMCFEEHKWIVRQAKRQKLRTKHRW